MKKYMYSDKKKERGGKRPFSGRKPAPYQTKTISFRVRIEWVDDIKAIIKKRIAELKSLD